ncbi:MAG TPA: hypothetical protein VLA04_06425 [Verrucomicrobiae bacterium]|nr:hypothetical protein [Verrucomicrobiae bacterium]
MSILDSSIAPYIFLVAGFSFLAGFFRKILVKVVIILAVEIIFLALFPKLLVHFVNLVSQASNLIR